MPTIRDFIYKPQRRHPCSVVALDGETVLPFELRLLNADETGGIEDRARAAAEAAGYKEPKPEDGPWLRTRMAETVLAAATDKDSPLEKPAPFFGSVAEVRRWLDDARIAYVYQEQRAFQSKYAPTPETASFDEFVYLVWASTKEAQQGGDPERPFVGLPFRKLTSFAANAASVLTQPTLPGLLFGSLTRPSSVASTDSEKPFADGENKGSSTNPLPVEPSPLPSPILSDRDDERR